MYDKSTNYKEGYEKGYNDGFIEGRNEGYGDDSKKRKRIKRWFKIF